jgi:flagellar basal-body rod modification protein FlgD
MTMNDIATNTVLSDMSISRKTADKPKSNELGQDAFLKLMITQMENQDPLSPQENTEFIAQLAQFSSVESLDKLNNQFSGFSSSFVANQALQASSLVGRSVTVPGDTAYLKANEVVTTSVDVPTSTSEMNISIYNSSGSLVEQIAAGPQAAGESVLRWDGTHLEVNGQLLDWSSSHAEGLPPGQYRFEVSASVEGKMTQLDTAVSANVNSVTVGANGTLTLNLAGMGAVNLADVKQFSE